MDIMRVGGDNGVNSEEKMISSDNNSNNGIKGSKEKYDQEQIRQYLSYNDESTATRMQSNTNWLKKSMSTVLLDA